VAEQEQQLNTQAGFQQSAMEKLTDHLPTDLIPAFVYNSGIESFQTVTPTLLVAHFRTVLRTLCL